MRLVFSIKLYNLHSVHNQLIKFFLFATKGMLHIFERGQGGVRDQDKCLSIKLKEREGGGPLAIYSELHI